MENVNEEEKRKVLSKIQEWLEEAKNPYTTYEDPATMVTLLVKVSHMPHAINIIIPKPLKDLLVIGERGFLSAKAQASFRRLPHKDQAFFIDDLSMTLLSLKLSRYVIEPATNPFVCEKFNGVTIEERIYFDGLTKDRFWQTFASVHSIFLLTETKVQRRTGGEGFSSSNTMVGWKDS